MFDEQTDRDVLKAIRSRKKTFEEVVNQKNITNDELDEVMQEDF